MVSHASQLSQPILNSKPVAWWGGDHTPHTKPPPAAPFALSANDLTNWPLGSRSSSPPWDGMSNGSIGFGFEERRRLERR